MGGTVFRTSGSGMDESGFFVIKPKDYPSMGEAQAALLATWHPGDRVGVFVDEVVDGVRARFWVLDVEAREFRGPLDGPRQPEVAS